VRRSYANAYSDADTDANAEPLWVSDSIRKRCKHHH
jgi:hypothetical protein